MSRNTRGRAVAADIDGINEVTALTALDLVRARLVEIDALAAAADDRIDAVPPVSDRDQRRRLAHLIELVVATARAARGAVEEAERLATAAMATRKKLDRHVARLTDARRSRR